MKNFQARRALLNTSALVGAIALSFGMASAASAQVSNYDIPSEPLSKALRDYGQASGRQIIFTEDLVRGHTTQALHGSYSSDAALARLLDGTGLVSELRPSGAVMIEKPVVPQRGGAQEEPPETVQEVVVTGSHIRGVQPSSPVVSLTANAILESGQTDLGEAIRSLPQASGAGQNPGIGLVAGGQANQNITSGSSLNLRGLGPDATLTLLNGHRPAYGGYSQSIDISAIPIAAVDQVQIVLDGASAVYGSDAVAGVANVVLKRDFEGVTASARLGGTSDGGDTQRQYSLVGGDRWSSGGFIAAINYEDDDGLYSQQRNFTNSMPAGSTIYPSLSTLNALISFHQDLTSFAHFKADLLYSHHWSDTSLVEPPYYLTSESTGEVATMVSPTLSFDLPHHWQLSVNGTISLDQTHYDYVTLSLARAPLSTTIGCYCNREKAAEIDASGPLVTLPAGPVQVALGAGYRYSYFDERSYTSSGYIGGGRTSGYTFGELAIPLVAPSQQIPGVRKLDLNLAARFEDYSDFGQVTTPKVGLVWSPISDFDLKVSWGKSFKAPLLVDSFEPSYVVLYPAALLGAHGYPASATAILTEGGNTNLKPERATTVTAGITYHPVNLSGLRLELGYFHIDYTDRVVQPIPIITSALSNPQYTPFINSNPSASAQAALIDAPGATFLNYSGGAYLSNSVVAVANNVYVNAAREEYQGVDLSGSYHTAALGGMLDLIASAAWLEGNEQASVSAPTVDTVGTVFNPPHWRTRTGLVWRRNGFDFATYLNYIGGVRNTQLTPNVNGASETTTDIAFGYKFGSQLGLLGDSQIQFSIINLFDKDPPYLKPAAVYAQPYDSTNYSAIGRLMSVTLSKHF